LSRLLIDIGNTRIKLACQDDGDIRSLPSTERSDWGHEPAMRVSAACEGFREVLVATVSRQRDEEIIHSLETNWGIEPAIIDTCRQSSLIDCAYEREYELGVDRWLAMIAAHKHSEQSVCVVDAGTAITIDAVSSGGRHLGGIILPGLAFMMKYFRDDLGLSVREISPRFTLGASTQQCIDAGFSMAIRAAVHTVMTMFQSPPCVWVTGGDGEHVRRILPFESRFEPLLVLQGLVLVGDESATS